MSMFAFNTQLIVLLVLLSVVSLAFLRLIKPEKITAPHFLKAILVACLAFSYLPAQAQSEWVGWPSADERDGRFLSVTGPLSAIDYVAPNIIIGIPGDATQFDIELFDGDASLNLTSKYDINVSTAGYTYALFADPNRDGAGGVPISSRTEAEFGNDMWSPYVTNQPVSDAALGQGDFYWYRLALSFNGNPDTEQFFNALKVRVRSSDSTTAASVSAFREVIIGSSPFNPILDPGLNSPENTYDGDWNFDVLVTGGAVPPISFSDSDADFAGDANAPGVPPDDNFSRPDFLISPSIRYEIFAPNGDLLTLNTDPSGTEEEETFSYNPPVAVPPGLYRWHWFGVDASNVFIIRTDFELFPATDTQPAALGNYVWLDENGDGMQDAGEAGIAGVNVILKNAVGDVIANTRTDTNGGYMFNKLVPGIYTVELDPLTLPAGVTQTQNPVLAGVDFGNQTLPYTVELGSGEVNLTADFGFGYGDPTGNQGPAALGDKVWIDTNGNGIQDGGEAGLGGVELTIYTDSDGNGVIEPGVDTPFTGAIDQQGNTGTGTTTTTADGSYVFTELPADAYSVVINPATLPAGYVQTADPDQFGEPATAPDNQTTSAVVLAPGDAFLNVDFGYQPDTAVVNTIGDTVFLDINANGVEDAGEAGVGDVTVSLLNAAGDPIATTTTDANGVYLFKGLPDGDYQVVVTDTNGALTELSQSADPDSTIDGMSSVNVAGGVSNLDQDFGYSADSNEPGLGVLGDTVFFDRNGNGLPDAGEGLGSVKVQLFDVTGTAMVAETMTNPDGLYLFGGLDPTASYVVKVDTTTLPAGLTNSVDPDGSNDSESAINLGADPDGTNDGINLDQDFGYVVDTNVTNPGTIGDTVWLDSNANGVNDGPLGADGIAGTDDDEPGIEGVTLDLYIDTNGDGVLQPGESRFASTETDNTGAYLFDQLPGGDYIVDVSDDAGVINGYWHSLGDIDTNDNSQTDPYAVNLPDGGAVVTADFGYYYQLASVGDFVWFDGNANGIQDANEPGIPGVQVELMIAYPDGTVSSVRTLTDSQGLYSFGNLLADESYNGDTSDGSDEPVFTISVVTPNGLTSSPVNQGSDDAVDSDNPQNELAEPVMGGIDATNDFGFYDLGSISGNVSEDIDRDGTIDGPLASVAVVLYADENQDGAADDLNGDGVINASDELARETTDSDGNYQFTDLAPGNYLVSEIDPDGYESTMDNDTVVDVPTDGTEIPNSNPRDNLLPVSLIVDLANLMVEDDNGNDFVDSPVLAGLGDTVWYDHNANGIQDANENGIEGVSVNLLDSSGAVVDTLVTDVTGFYQFTDLLPGDYTVEVDPTTLGADLQQTYDLDDGATLSPATPNAASVSLAAGDSNTDIDFGYRPLGSLGDTVWFDLNANGVVDASEEGIAGVTVTLTGPVTATTTTDADGFYQFTDLPLGSYNVTVSGTALDNLEQTHDLDDPVSTDPATANTADAELALSAAGDSIGSRDDVDFGYRQKSSIVGTVTEDTDGDGAGDQPQVGVTVELYEDSDGDGQPDTLVDSMVTDANGAYIFSDLPAGDYVVIEITPDNLTDVSDEDSTQDGDPFDSDTTVDDQIAVTLNAGETDDGNDFVDENGGSISGTVTEDTTGDGLGDTPQQGVIVELYEVDNNGNPVGNPIATATTAADGSYTFENVSPGNYAVAEVQPAGLSDVSDSDATPEDGNDGDTAVDNLIPVSVLPGEADDDNNFVDVNMGGITGTVTEDTTGDNAGDTPIQSVMLELYADTDGDGQPDGVSLLTTTTDTNGNYSFLDIAPGDYIVVQTQPDDLISITDRDESPDGDAFDADATVDNQVAASVISGELDDANNFVEQKLASISGWVALDTDGDGHGDTALPGVELALQNSAGNVIATTTSATGGGYSFNDLPAGDYTVVETQPSGYDSVKDEDAETTGFGDPDPQDSDDTVDNTVGSNLKPGEQDIGNNFVENALQPAIDIRKQQEGDDSRIFSAGDTVEFEIEVTNTGSVDLNNVVVSDPQLPACDNTIGSLGVGESVTYTCSMVLDSGTSESKTWLDNFSPAYSYSGNDGNSNFTGNWVENDPQGGGASSGRVLVGSNNKLWMNNYGYPGGSSFKPTVKRSVDLSGMDSATLSFDWITHAGVDNNDAVALDVRVDGGSWTELDKFWGVNTGGKSESYDITDYISANTQFRFKVSDNYGGSDETLKLDNFKIVASVSTDPAAGFINIANVTGDAIGQTVTDSDPSEVIVDGVCVPQPSDSHANGQSYSIWINGEYFSANSGNRFVPNVSNGTATYKGSVTSNSSGTTYSVDMKFSGFTTTAPAGSPKLPGFAVDASSWVYYTSISGSVGPYTASRRGPALQVGYGANMNDAGYGASGWMYFRDGETTLNGDINISLTDCGEPPVVCDKCISGQSQITLQISNWSSSRDQGETIRVREGGLGGALLFEGTVSNNESFTFDMVNPGATIVITVQGYYHPSEYVKGMFVTDCDLNVNQTNGNSYITFKVTDLVSDAQDGPCPDEVVPPISNAVTTTISNAYAGMCLDTLGSDVGSSVYKRSCTAALNQSWELKPQGSYYEIANADSNMCLDVYSSSGSLNAEVGQWACTQNANQLWEIQSYGSEFLLKSKSSGMCLEIQGAGNAYQYTCDGYVGQKWNLTLP